MQLFSIPDLKRRGNLRVRPNVLIAHWKIGTRFAANRWKYSRIYQTAFSCEMPFTHRASYTAILGKYAYRSERKVLWNLMRFLHKGLRIAFELPMQFNLLLLCRGLRKLSCMFFDELLYFHMSLTVL